MNNLSDSKVLITGGAGFIGSHLADKLVNLGTEIKVIDNFDEFYNGKDKNVKNNLKKDNYNLVKGDILSLETLISLTKGVSIIFHQAAQAGLRHCNEHPMKAHNVNVTGTINVLTAARINKVKRVVYASSSSIFGPPQNIPMNETHPTNPHSPYGATKLAAEKYCIAFNKVYGTSTVCLRYFSVYGPRGRPDQVFFNFANKIKNGEQPIIFGDGSQTRDFTYIDDVVDANIRAATVDDADGRVFNIGYGSELSIREAAAEIATRLDSSITPNFLPSYKGDFPRTQADNKLAKEIIGWTPKVGIQEGLDNFADWFKKNNGNRE
jgi:UDP-glucose 4-epimerase